MKYRWYLSTYWWRWQAWTLWGYQVSPVQAYCWHIYVGPLRLIRYRLPAEREEKFL